MRCVRNLNTEHSREADLLPCPSLRLTLRPGVATLHRSMMPRYAASTLERLLAGNLNSEHLNLNTPQRGFASMASSIDTIRAPGLSLRRPSVDRRGLRPSGSNFADNRVPMPSDSSRSSVPLGHEPEFRRRRTPITSPPSLRRRWEARFLPPRINQ